MLNDAARCLTIPGAEVEAPTRLFGHPSSGNTQTQPPTSNSTRPNFSSPSCQSGWDCVGELTQVLSTQYSSYSKTHADMVPEQQKLDPLRICTLYVVKMDPASANSTGDGRQGSVWGCRSLLIRLTARLYCVCLYVLNDTLYGRRSMGTSAPFTQSDTLYCATR